MSLNACYKGLKPGEKCGLHSYAGKGTCPPHLSPRERTEAFLENNHPALAMYSSGLFAFRLLETIEAAVADERKQILEILEKFHDTCSEENPCNICDARKAIQGVPPFGLGRPHAS